MTAADRIVVMRDGRIEQQGTPAEIYERPATEFVARFIGGTNILRESHLGGNPACAARAPRCNAGRGKPRHGGDTAVSIRPHEIRLIEEAGGPGGNRVRGRIERQVYAGTDARLSCAPAGRCGRACGCRQGARHPRGTRGDGRPTPGILPSAADVSRRIK